MKCHVFRNRTLAEWNPLSHSEESHTHLASCVDCQIWFQNVTTLETSLHLLSRSVLKSTTKGTFIQSFLQGIPTPSVETSHEHLPASATKIEAESVAESFDFCRNPSPTCKNGHIASRPLGKKESLADLPTPAKKANKKQKPFSWTQLWPAGVIAATLLVATVAVFQVKNQPSNDPPALPDDPFLAEMVQTNLAIASSKTPLQRSEKFAELSERIYSQMQTIAKVDTGENLARLAKCYQRVLIQGVIGTADEIPTKERNQFLDRMVQQLNQTREQAEQLAQEVPTASVASFKDAAFHAKEASIKIRSMLNGGTS